MKVLDTAIGRMRRALGRDEGATIPALRLDQPVPLRDRVRLRLASSARFEPV